MIQFKKVYLWINIKIYILLYISQGTLVLLAIHDLHNGEYWKEPSRFRPERFLTKEGNLIQDESLMPFGCGKVCFFYRCTP